ncbi:P1 family peptidase [Roseibium salinum]|uniref:P1 family peptidase n=1 Tax=Roseibium salinum TaxID=1604349 RepID=A0ABT3QZY0_9HYPH|nr:P1 family peptidase [Roseibium sp. DSM 29163]MCX2722511.1 P1 family peptidase [Roseibium sp. DSM 29163]
MSSKSRSPCSSYGLACGTLEAGKGNTIADVAGVTVGHFTLRDGDLRTGFTALLPHQGNLFCEKLTAAVEVINGFGKSAGLVQVDELGTLETPVLLTNTFGVGTGVNALIRRAISENPEIGRSTGTVNPVVLECNDGYLSDIQAMALTEAHVVAAIEAASESFEQGSVGAGTGMSAFGFKGGIGSASRVYELDGRRFTLGALVLANFGRPGDLVLPDGRRPHPKDLKRAEERGSVIVVLATDVPLESRQLKRIAKRAGAGLARLGAFYGNGSGDIALAFTTAGRVAHFASSDFVVREILVEDRIDILFQAAAETTQEAVLNAMIASPAMRGRGRNKRPSLADWLAANG